MKPMLAGKTDGFNLDYPVFVSPKLDGIRAIVKDGVVLSRSLKPIPQPHVQTLFSHLEGFDGELIYGSPTNFNAYNVTMSYAMTQNLWKSESIKFHVFDLWNSKEPFTERLLKLRKHFTSPIPQATLLIQRLVSHEDFILHIEQDFLAAGYEGMMIRKPTSLYKFGRSTTREGTLLKLKRFSDADAVIIDSFELNINQNEPEIDNLGYTKRSTKQEGKVGGNTLGGFIVQDLETKIQFDIGSGFTDATRKDLWEQRDNLPGKIIKYKHFPHGTVEKPRFPIFLSFRDPLDI